jgi:hypothetical protein
MEEIKTEAEVETGFDPNRRLCPDGACVGVIGPQGRCTVCARPGDADSVNAEVDGDARAVDPGRRLCDDGSCVGVVGADGVCGTCGRKAD